MRIFGFRDDGEDFDFRFGDVIEHADFINPEAYLTPETAGIDPRSVEPNVTQVIPLLPEGSLP